MSRPELRLTQRRRLFSQSMSTIPHCPSVASSSQPLSFDGWMIVELCSTAHHHPSAIGVSKLRGDEKRRLQATVRTCMSYVAGHGGSSGESSDFHTAGPASELSSLPPQCWVD